MCVATKRIQNIDNVVFSFIVSFLSQISFELFLRLESCVKDFFLTHVVLTNNVDVVYKHYFYLKFEIRYRLFHFGVQLYLILNLHIMKFYGTGLSRLRHSDHYKTKSLKSNFYLYEVMHIDKHQNV